MHCGSPNQNVGRAMAHPAALPMVDSLLLSFNRYKISYVPEYKEWG